MTVLVECGFTHLCTSEVSHRPPGAARGSAHTSLPASASALLHPCSRLEFLVTNQFRSTNEGKLVGLFGQQSRLVSSQTDKLAIYPQ